jgi:Zn-dependent peptidase ImmA (M78 family)
MLKQRNQIDADGSIELLADGIARYSLIKFGKIDLEAIAYSNRITFSYGEYGNSFDGLLECMNSKFHIYINNSGNSGRDRFTFGHELGHYFIPEHNYALINGFAPAHCSLTGFKSEELIERQADFFASNLLLPKNDLLKIYRSERKFKFETILKIQQHFEVSLQAALYRIFFLNLHPLMMIKSENGKIIGKPVFNDSFFLKLNDKDNIPKDSLAYHIIESGNYSDKTTELWKMDWFDTDSHGKMYERCIYFNNQITSVLWTD